MPKYVAFLRALNVGGHVVKMDALRRIFEKAGASDVETVIASGNVIFRSGSKSERTLAARLAASLEDALGYEVATFLRTPAELAEVARQEPFPGEERYGLYVAFLAAPPSAATVAKLLALQTENDRFRVFGREVYWLCRTRSSDSKFSGPLFERTLGAQTTLRNATTVRKVAARCGG
jgi:uncharacterized protein (DUF1697 family)